MTPNTLRMPADREVTAVDDRPDTAYETPFADADRGELTE